MADPIAELTIRAVRIPVFINTARAADEHEVSFYAELGGTTYSGDSLKALRSRLLDAAKRKGLEIDVPFDMITASAGSRDRWGDVRPGTAANWAVRRGHVKGIAPRDENLLVVFDDDRPGTAPRDCGRLECDAEQWLYHDEHVTRPMSTADREEIVGLYDELYRLHESIGAWFAEREIDVKAEVNAAISAKADDERPEPAAPRGRNKSQRAADAKRPEFIR